MKNFRKCLMLSAASAMSLALAACGQHGAGDAQQDAASAAAAQTAASIDAQATAAPDLPNYTASEDAMKNPAGISSGTAK